MAQTTIDKVTSKNRAAARKLLNTWHSAATVRMWTLAQLQEHLGRVCRDGLITQEGINRALNAEKKSGEVQHDAQQGDVEDHDSNVDGNADGERGENNDYDKLPKAAEAGRQDARDGKEPRGDYGDDAEQEAYDMGYLAQESAQEDGDSDGNGDADGDSESDSDSDGDEEGDEETEQDEEQESDEESEQESDEEQEQELRCDACAKVCTQDELYAGSELTDREGEALCHECDVENEKTKREPDPIHHMMYATVLKYIKAGLSVALVGPTGSGKSRLCRDIAETLGADYYVNGAMMTKYDLIGYKDANGTYHSTPAHDAFVNGGIHVFDELDASAPDAVVAFNGMTDDQPFYTFPDGQQEKHADYIPIACMNTYGNGANADYVGRYKQDAAAMSRFVMVFIDYDRGIEKTLGDKDIVDRVWSLRDACETLGLKHIVSTRMIQQGDASRKQRATRKEIDRDILFAGLDDAAITQVKAQMKAQVQS